MELDPNACYQAVLTNDTRFDGLFFVGVSTTGIYCRTVCTARTPGRERCSFYPSAAAAERAGYRPCLRCRPELAPGNARIDAVERLAAVAASRIEDGALTEGRVADLAAELGVSDRHLRRVVEREFGVSPIELAQTQRLLLAKRLLTDTALPVTEIAFASGFASLRRFNALFRERYGLNPTDLRRGHRSSVLSDRLICEIAYRPPFAWEPLRRFLVSHAAQGVEAEDGARYLRTASLGQHRGWITVEPSGSRHTLQVEVSPSLLPALLPTLARVKHLFDLTAAPEQIAAHLGPLAADCPGLRIPGAFDGFETAVRAILGQQISVRSATTLAGRLTARFGEPIATPFTPLTHLPPTPERLAAAEVEEIIALGIIRARAHTLQTLARAVVDDRIVLKPGADIETSLTALKSLPGIGEWTAQYLAMRVLAWPDAFPHTDLGIAKALGESRPAQILQRAEPWRPWRAYAAMHLWRSLET